MTIGEAIAAIERDAHEPDKTLTNAASLRTAVAVLRNAELSGQDLWNALYVPPRTNQTIEDVRADRFARATELRRELRACKAERAISHGVI